MSEGNGLKVGRIRADRGGESAFDVPHRSLDDDRRPAGQGDAGCSDVATVLKAPSGLLGPYAGAPARLDVVVSNETYAGLGDADLEMGARHKSAPLQWYGR